MGFPRQEIWSGVPLPTPGDLPNPGIKPVSSALTCWFFPTEPPGKPQYEHNSQYNQNALLCLPPTLSISLRDGGGELIFLSPQLKLLTASLALPDDLHLHLLAIIVFFSQIEDRARWEGKRPVSYDLMCGFMFSGPWRWLKLVTPRGPLSGSGGFFPQRTGLGVLDTPCRPPLLQFPQ